MKHDDGCIIAQDINMYNADADTCNKNISSILLAIRHRHIDVLNTVR